MQKNIICVSCPMGCGITVELNDSGEVVSVTGNTCKRGRICENRMYPPSQKSCNNSQGKRRNS